MATTTTTTTPACPQCGRPARGMAFLGRSTDYLRCALGHVWAR